MRSQITSAAAAIALMMSGVDTRKHMVNNSERQVGTPNVRDCENLCLFKDADEQNYWCFDFSTPHIKAGWQWDQTNSTDDDATPLKHLRLDITGYVEFYFKVVSKFQIDQLYKNEFTVDIPSFKAYLFSGFIVNQKFQFCPGVGWSLGTIDLKLSMIHNMMNCTKTILKNFWNVEGIWTGTSAQIFEDCGWSQDDTEDDPEVELDFVTVDLFTKKTDQMLLGTVDPESD